MTRSLRQRHRRIFTALAVLLPVVFAVGIAARKTVPPVGATTPDLALSRVPFGSEQWRREDLFPKTRIQVGLFRETADQGRFVISLAVAKDFARPDLLVYWAVGRPVATNALPANAILLGACAPSVKLPLPAASFTTEGALIIYNLAENEVVDISRTIRFDGSKF